MLKIAFRNVLRNGRRSFMTASAIAVGACALILFGEYNGMAMLGMTTEIVRSSGHLSVFHKGYFEFGSAQPLAYGISAYDDVIKTIKSDAALKPVLRVVTPTASLGGIAGNAAVDRSKTFFGQGIVPSDKDKMASWDQYRFGTELGSGGTGLKDDDVDHGVIGKGLARILGLCKPLQVANCPETNETRSSFLSHTSDPSKGPRIDLLGSAGGAPNIVAFYPTKARGMGAKEVEDSYVEMNLPLAQRLLYGGGEKKVTAIEIQLNRMEDLVAAKARLKALFAERHLDLEVRDYKELQPDFLNILGFLQVIFAFVAVVLGIIVIFTTANTMGMSIMERTNEIGTARAMGVRRGGIHRQFLLEGAILGMIGASCGIVLGMVMSWVINHSNIRYTPPGNASPVPLTLLTHGTESLMIGIWIALVIMATLASIIPANHAARMKVADALRHV